MLTLRPVGLTAIWAEVEPGEPMNAPRRNNQVSRGNFLRDVKGLFIEILYSKESKIYSGIERLKLVQRVEPEEQIAR